MKSTEKAIFQSNSVFHNMVEDGYFGSKIFQPWSFVQNIAICYHYKTTEQLYHIARQDIQL